MSAPPALQSQTIVGRKGALMEVLVTFLESKLGTSSQVKVYQTIFFFLRFEPISQGRNTKGIGLKSRDLLSLLSSTSSPRVA